MNTDKKFLDLVEKSLHYLLSKCSPEEYNPELVKALIRLKRSFTPKSDNADLKYVIYHNPTARQQRIIHIRYTPHPKKRTVAALGIAIAACIISIILIGNNTPSLALPDTGFFLIIQKDKDGILAITSPDISKEMCKDCPCCQEHDCSCSDATE